MKLPSFITSAVFGISASTVAARNWDVNVGKNGALRYDPDNISGAQQGDTVTYHFFAKNHSVVQSSFDDPCHPLKGGGFFSAFVPDTSATIESDTTFQIPINDTKPIWVYCAQTTGNHCQSGMVSAINAPSSGNTLSKFQDKAKKASTSTSPNSDPPGGSPVGGLRKVQVQVGRGTHLVYEPNDIIAPPGTVVSFNYNPKNHSVVQSAFVDPCHPINAGGFSSGFIPTMEDNSEATFDVLINNTIPVWFYCAQTTKSHCQSGMVGSVNAPRDGNTLAVFKKLAAKAGTSTIPPEAPVGGVFTFKGTVIDDFKGAVFDNDMTIDPGSIGKVPPPGTTMSPYMVSMAGGATPQNYHWGPSISENATDFLQLLQFLDNILLEVLYGGYNNLTTGPWKGQYPKSITDTFQSIAAQAMVHRCTSTDSLQHYKKQVMGVCKYSFPIQNVEDFVQIALVLLLLEVGILLDISSQTSPGDSWMIPALGTNLGSKSRMTGVINMIQDHTAATAPREVMMPAPLVYSYVMQHYVVPNSCPDKMSWTTVMPKLVISNKVTDGSERTTSIIVTLEGDVSSKPDLHIGWIGPWGGLEYTPLSKGVAEYTASVPKDLYGHVWAIVVTGQGYSLQDIVGKALTSPEIVWVTDPQFHGSQAS